ncbi:hypothetical protein M7I_1361 [Glarea lozoyensis 74030]|uniref:Uncharacterized protein n=1 Tax=Glarea lozoyensis (strain ATCC 74030 / MF5533) TaxID=1104152 RepID=H0EFV3_GLAL7|nr:hypothetical protein M7I_1361 [Glarea lozoyensis 74030]
MVTDKRGRAKWTVSIPPDSDFPLEPKQYADICSQNMEVATHVADMYTRVHKEHAAHYGYYHVDKNFMDVAEAEAHGLLPGPKARTSMKASSLLGENLDGLVESDVCEKSMTFVLETQDAGLGNTLLMLWTAYGLAKKEGRAFFLDDSRWPPPRHEMLPCPHHARHLLVSAATAGHVFGGGFNGYYEDARKMEVYRQKPMFNFAREGYEALFQLANEDEEYVDKRIAEMRGKTVTPGDGKINGIVVGIHVRHGDRRPFEFQYKDSYIPLEKYVDTAKEILRETFNGSRLGNDGITEAASHSIMLLASDDPDVYASEELSEALPAQQQIRLASNKHISNPQPQGPTGMRNFVDEAVGWEGGFFAPMFWSLGRPNGLPPTAVTTPDVKVPPTDEALRLRELVGRAYLMDLAVLGQASDKIVCTVSSAGCRILAIMLGWDKSFDKAGFMNVDGTFDWRGISW